MLSLPLSHRTKLHLAGEDHQTPAQATQMEAQEIAILATLGWPSPY